MIMDLREVKTNNFGTAESGNQPLIASLLLDHNVVDVNGVGISQTSALHQCVRLVLLCTGKFINSNRESSIWGLLLTKLGVFLSFF